MVHHRRLPDLRRCRTPSASGIEALRPFEETASSLVAQPGFADADLDPYATQEETRHAHMTTLRQFHGYGIISCRGTRAPTLWL